MSDAQSQIMVVKELDYFIKKEPQNNDQWYVSEAVNTCSNCVEKQVLIDQLENDLKIKTQNVLELEMEAKRMGDVHKIEVQELKLKFEQKNHKTEDKEFYEVECILDDKHVGGKQKFFVKWEGYNESHNTWVDTKDLHCKKLLQKYLKSKN